MSINIISSLKEVDAQSPSYRIFNGNDMVAGVMGTGWTGTGNVFGNSLTYQTTSVSGQGGIRYCAGSNNAPITLGQPKGGINWAKGVKLTTLICRDSTPIDSNISFRLSFGKTGASNGDLTVKGIGWKFIGTGAIQLMVHNGSALTISTNGTYLLSDANTHSISVESDGLGNAKLIVDNVQVASCSGAPIIATGTSSSNSIIFDGLSSGTPLSTGTLFIGQIHLQTDI